MPPIDQSKINAFLAEWNSGRPDGQPLWVEVQGLSSLMTVTLGESGNVIFQGNQGFVVKAFLNVETQEVKMLNVRRFTLV